MRELIVKEQVLDRFIMFAKSTFLTTPYQFHFSKLPLFKYTLENQKRSLSMEGPSSYTFAYFISGCSLKIHRDVLIHKITS
uniref:Uncharacterized protein n=1 Tax=Aegilops tauschii subsp. strangulata TaxID=200361 RepID=A0A453KZI6_AEGTS